jgi:DNA-binding Lrp family transcriptional regulator
VEKKLDKTDRRILQHLQRNGRIPNNELADAVHLSPSSCLRRVRALEDAGIIKGYVTLLDPAKIGKGFTAYARVWLTAQDLETVQRFVDAIQSIPEVVECHLMAGECDVMLRVVAADLTAYRKFQIDHLTRMDCVRSVKTEIPMEQAKLTSELPI